MNQTTIKSYHRFIISTNKDDPIATSKDDRRNLIIRSSDELVNNKIYFDKLHHLLDDVNVIRTCYDYFKNLPDLDKFHLQPIPKTAHQTELKKLSLSVPEQYLKYLCETNTQFFKNFQDWLADNNTEYETTPFKLGSNWLI
jgi:hypothetical protein